MAIISEEPQCKFFEPRIYSNWPMNHLTQEAGSKICCISFSAELFDILQQTTYLVLKLDPFHMPRTTRNCKLLIAYDFINNISFLIDSGSSYSLIGTSIRERKINPDPTVLYSATSNVIQTYGKHTLKINFNSSVNYIWDFIKTDLNFSIIGLDFLNFYKLTVDTYKRCLIDTRNNVAINLNPCYCKPPSVTCVLPKQSQFQDILAKYQNVVTPTSRFERQPVNIQHAIVTNGEIVKSKLRHMSPEIQKVVDEQINEWLRDGIISRSDSPFTKLFACSAEKIW